MELDDQVQSALRLLGEGGHLVAAIASVAGEPEGAVGEPAQQQTQQHLHDLSRGLVGPPALVVVLARAIQGHQHGQRPGSLGEGEADQDSQDDPLVPPAPGRIGVAGTHGVAVTRLAVDLASGVLGDGVVADKRDGASGPEAKQEEAGQRGGQSQAGPVSLGQDAVVTGVSARGEVSERAQQVGDGASSGGENGSDGQQLHALKGGRVESGGEQGEDRQGLCG